MMDKINDNMNANGQQKLSMEDLDKVSGGAGECFDAAKIKTEEELDFYVYEYIGTIEKTCGKDVAVNILKSQFPVFDIVTGYEQGDLSSLHNRLGQVLIDGRKH